MYDAIVVGARCAGAGTAMLLARAGHRVLLLDRARFPSDTMSTHYLHPPAMVRLHRWGLLDRLRATGCTPMGRVRIGIAGLTLSSPIPALDDVAISYAPRRRVLDTLLGEAAVEAGAQLRQDCTVTGLVTDEGRVCGVRIRSGGRDSVEHARVVIGADGLDSVVARSVGADTYDEFPTMSCAYYSYWSGLAAPDYEISTNGNRGVGVAPSHDGLVVVGVQWPRSEFDAVRHDVDRAYRQAAATASPELGERLADATREERYIGTGRLPNFYRQAYGPGWALVGDAGHHKDPVGGYGISDALAHAELLAGRLDGALHGERTLDEALADYAEERDRESMSRYQFNLEAAKFDPLPELVNVLRVIEGDAEQMARFFGLVSGVLAMDQFFTPELIGQAMLASPEQAVVEQDLPSVALS